MWSYQKIKFEVFIHNDDVKCFQVVVEGTQKMVMMGCINFEDQTLIRRWWACEKMNVAGGKRKNEKNNIIVESGFCFLLKIVSVFEVLEIT